MGKQARLRPACVECPLRRPDDIDMPDATLWTVQFRADGLARGTVSRVA